MDELAQRRFWSKVNVIPDETSCWEWTAAISKNGYGRFVVDTKKSYPEDAHVVAYREFVGPIDKRQVQHKCHNKKCVRLDHLKLGDHSSNAIEWHEQRRLQGPQLSDEQLAAIEREIKR